MIIDGDSLPTTLTAFTSTLARSLEHWKEQGKRGIWLQIPVAQAAFIAPAINEAGGLAWAGAFRIPYLIRAYCWSAATILGTLSRIELDENAVIAGFEFHHAEKTHAMLTRWLSDDMPSTIPPNASHQVGVGAFVVNERREVLVVQEKNGPLKGTQVTVRLSP